MGSSPTSRGPDLSPSSSHTLPYAGTYPMKWYTSSVSSFSLSSISGLHCLDGEEVLENLARFAGEGLASRLDACEGFAFSFDVALAWSRVVTAIELSDPRRSAGLQW